VPEWGNLPAGMLGLAVEHIGRQGERGELKHLSTHRKREDSLSSGERKGRSPNHCRARLRSLREWGRRKQRVFRRTREREEG